MSRAMRVYFLRPGTWNLCFNVFNGHHRARPMGGTQINVQMVQKQEVCVLGGGGGKQTGGPRVSGQGD